MHPRFFIYKITNEKLKESYACSQIVKSLSPISEEDAKRKETLQKPANDSCSQLMPPTKFARETGHNVHHAR